MQVVLGIEGAKHTSLLISLCPMPSLSHVRRSLGIGEATDGSAGVASWLLAGMADDSIPIVAAVFTKLPTQGTQLTEPVSTFHTMESECAWPAAGMWM